MNRLVCIAALAVAVACPPAAALAAAPRTQTRVSSDCRHERYKPRQIVIACADGTEVLKGLRWSSWQRARAAGKGTAYVVSCNPDCAAGHQSAYPVTIKLTRPEACPGHSHPVFSRALLTFTKTRPHHRRTETDQLGCPI